MNYFKKITSNRKQRYFTLWFKDGSKFRTYPLSKEEFEVAEFNTENDWKQFLKSDGYYPL